MHNNWVKFITGDESYVIFQTSHVILTFTVCKIET